MPRVITVRQFPPSESFNNLVILESPKSEKQGSWLYPCLPAKKRLKIRYQSIWGSAQQVCVQHWQTRIVTSCEGSVGYKSDCGAQSSDAVAQGEQWSIDVSSLNHSHTSSSWKWRAQENNIFCPHSETQNEDDRWYLHTLEAGSNNVKLQRAFVVGLGGSLRACAVSQRFRKTIYIFIRLSNFMGLTSSNVAMMSVFELS